jgi:hypothetical protein
MLFVWSSGDGGHIGVATGAPTVAVGAAGEGRISTTERDGVEVRATDRVGVGETGGGA